MCTQESDGNELLLCIYVFIWVCVEWVHLSATACTHFLYSILSFHFLPTTSSSTSVLCWRLTFCLFFFRQRKQITQLISPTVPTVSDTAVAHHLLKHMFICVIYKIAWCFTETWAAIVWAAQNLQSWLGWKPKALLMTTYLEKVVEKCGFG